MSTATIPYGAVKPDSKRLTVIDTVSDNQADFTSFYTTPIKNGIGGRKTLDVKVQQKYWPDTISVNSTYGLEVVFSHTKLDYKTHSGWVTEINEKDNRYVLSLVLESQ